MFIVNEIEYAEKIIKNGIGNNHFASKLKYLAKYYIKKGHKTEEINALLKDFITKKCPSLEHAKKILNIAIENIAIKNAIKEIKKEDSLIFSKYQQYPIFKFQRTPKYSLSKNDLPK